MEYSGYRGYHIWIFFTEWIPVRYVNALSQILGEKFEDIRSEDITMEFFPDDRRIRAGKPGQSIRASPWPESPERPDGVLFRPGVPAGDGPFHVHEGYGKILPGSCEEDRRKLLIL